MTKNYPNKGEKKKMINFKTKFSVAALVLITTLLMSMAYPLQAVNTTSNTTVNFSHSSKTVNVLNAITGKYLSFFGFQSNQSLGKSQTIITSNSEVANASDVYTIIKNGPTSSMNVQNSLQILKGTTSGYLYNGKFDSNNGKSYSVIQTNSTVVKGNQVITSINQSITGSINYRMSSTITKINNFNTTGQQISTNMGLSNSTGNYFFNLVSSEVDTLDQSLILNKTAIINENIYAPFGQTTLFYTPINTTLNGEKIIGDKVTLILPNGTIIDPDTYTFANGQTDGNGNALYGWWIWWDEAMGEPGLSVMKDILSNLTGFDPFSLITSLVEDSLLASGYLYKSDMTDSGGDITMQYVELILLSGIIPSFVETGYRTDRMYTINGWEYFDQWYYVPLWPNGDYSHWHPGPFPIGYFDSDPPVSVYSCNDATSTLFECAPFYLDSYYAGVTSSTVDLTAGTYTIAVPSYGLFEYFDIAGTIVYDNPATITIEQNQAVIIIAHYSDHPYAWLNIGTYDQQINPVDANIYIDNNWVGDGYASVYLPIGTHAFTTDTSVWDDYLQTYVYVVNSNWNGVLSGTTNAAVYYSEP